MTTKTQNSPALADIAARSLANDSDRPAWLAARKGRITATAAKVVYAGTPSAKGALTKDLLGGKSKPISSKYIDWGNYREGVIAEDLRGIGLELCGDLVRHPDKDYCAATPDMIGVDFDDNLMLAEIKTTKYAIPVGSEQFEKNGYLYQMLWQLYCTGAKAVWYVWEMHNDDWRSWDSRPMDDESVWHEYGPQVISRTSELISLTPENELILMNMVKAVDEYYNSKIRPRLEKAAADGDEVTEAPAEEVSQEAKDALAAFGKTYRDSLKAEKAAAAAKSAAAKSASEFAGRLGLKERTVLDIGEIRFTINPAGMSASTIVTDMEAATAAMPAELALELQAAGEAVAEAHLRARAANDQAEAFARDFTKEEPGKPTPFKLSITEIKQKG